MFCCPEGRASDGTFAVLRQHWSVSQLRSWGLSLSGAALQYAYGFRCSRAVFALSARVRKDKSQLEPRAGDRNSWQWPLELMAEIGGCGLEVSSCTLVL